MSDRALAGIILIVAAAYGAYLYWRRLAGGAAVSAGSAKAGGSPAGGSTAPVLGGDTASISPLDHLLGFAQSEGLTVTSTTGGKHAPGSAHYQGRAIDVGVQGLSVQQIAKVISDATAQGFRVLKELYTGAGTYGYSSGPHLHIEAPRSRFADAAP